MMSSDRIEEAISTLGLDDRAADALRAMAPDAATELLDSIGPNLKNPSAYITKAVNDRAHGKGKFRGAPISQKGENGKGHSSRLQDHIRELQLDDRAADVLTSMPTSQALELIDSMPGNVRNASAYITKAVNDRAHGKWPAHMGAHHFENQLSQRVESAIRSFGLDGQASEALHNLDPSQAVELLDSVPANVRNVSAYLTRAANDRARGKSHPVFAAQRIDPSMQIEQAVVKLGLDSRAASTLRDMDPWQALELLESVSPTVRNASAYITKAANDRMHQPPPGMYHPVMYAAPPSQHFMPQPMLQRYDQYPVASPALPVKRPREDAQNSAEIEAQIEALQLDDKASNLLRRLEHMDALGLLQSMDTEVSVRNPSAFITKAANDRLNGKFDVESQRWSQVTALAEELGLDERAKQVVMELPAVEAYRVLSNCREKADSVNNPSAYVLKGVAAVQREMDPYSKRRRMA